MTDHSSHSLPNASSSSTSQFLSSTSSHPPQHSPDPTLSVSNATTRGVSSSTSSRAAELSRLTLDLRAGLRQFPDFPSPGVLFEDIMPLFANPVLHSSLIRALELHVLEAHSEKIDVVVGLDARGFLFGPSLALKLGAGFVPVRKQGKLPGECVTAGYKKEYGEDFFQMQVDGVKAGQKVLIIDDIIATGGSATAAGSLVEQLGGTLLGFVFILELDFLKGRDKLKAPVHTLLSSQNRPLSS